MSSLGSYLGSTIGKKQLIGLAGLGLSLFILTHMAGNLLIFVGPEAYNKYGHALTSNPLIYLAEGGLIAIFVLHIILATFLTAKNQKAKKSKYAVSASKTEASFASKTLWFQGVVILAFVIWHLLTFKFGETYYITYQGEEIRDLFKLMVEVFQSPIYVAGYVTVVAILWLHVGHGFSSSLQTLGLNGERMDPVVTKLGHAYAAIVCLGFIIQPIFVYFVY